MKPKTEVILTSLQGNYGLKAEVILIAREPPEERPESAPGSVPGTLPECTGVVFGNTMPFLAAARRRFTRMALRFSGRE